jgi:hypothetical protein
MSRRRRRRVPSSGSFQLRAIFLIAAESKPLMRTLSRPSASRYGRPACRKTATRANSEPETGWLNPHPNEARDEFFENGAVIQGLCGGRRFNQSLVCECAKDRIFAETALADFCDNSIAADRPTESRQGAPAALPRLPRSTAAGPTDTGAVSRAGAGEADRAADVSPAGPTDGPANRAPA